MIELIAQILGAYIITVVIVDAPSLDKYRRWIVKVTPKLIGVNRGIDISNPRHLVHLVECRLCTGFWVSLLITFIYGNIEYFLLVYGASHFLAMQER